jgi:MFS transporter, AAHS family, 4-hydroxybenzoate transporter
LTLAIAFGAGFGLIGGQAAANALAAMSYPTEMRSLGAGWALGIGSVGSITGPAIGAMLLEGQVGIRNVFLLSAVPALLTALAMLALGWLLARLDAAKRRAGSLAQRSGA